MQAARPRIRTKSWKQQLEIVLRRIQATSARSIDDSRTSCDGGGAARHVILFSGMSKQTRDEAGICNDTDDASCYPTTIRRVNPAAELPGNTGSLWWDLFTEHRRAICYIHLDFISLIALAVTCTRALADTQWARGMRMAHPTAPERIPRATKEEKFAKAPVSRSVYHLWRYRGLRHKGYLWDWMTSVCAMSVFDIPTFNALAATLADSLLCRDQSGFDWFCDAFRSELALVPSSSEYWQFLIYRLVKEDMLVYLDVFLSSGIGADLNGFRLEIPEEPTPTFRKCCAALQAYCKTWDYRLMATSPRYHTILPKVAKDGQHED